jgi:hypothetical protein
MRFRLTFAEREGTLRFVNECRARVTYHTGPTTRTVTVNRGRPDERTFEVPDRADDIDITPNVLVEVLP